MGVETQKYIRKPLFVDAVRVTAANFDELAAWCQGEVLQDEIPGKGTTKKYIKVRVHNPKDTRQTKAFIGDWILYTDRGYKVYTNKAFRHAFDLVEEHANDDLHESSSEQAPEPNGEPVGDAAQDGALVTSTPVEQSPAMAQAVETIEAEGGTVEEATPQGIADVVNEQQPVAEEPVPYEETDDEFQTEQPKVLTEDEAREEMDLPPREETEGTPIAPPPTPAIIPPEPEARLQTETGDEGKIKHEPVESNKSLKEPFSQGGGGPVDLADDVEQDLSVKDQRSEIAAAGKRVLSEEEQRQMGAAEVRQLVSTGEVVLAQDLVQQ
jgi:hypothetical protein